jgi:hypothetical protein
MAWDTPGQPYTVIHTAALGGFPAHGALVVVFTTPAVTTPPTSGVGSFAVADYQGPTAARSGALSLTPCDFTVGVTGQGGTYDVFANDTGPSGYFTLDYEESGYLELSPSTTYYLNVENPMGCSPGPDCDVIVTLTKQRGT